MTTAIPMRATAELVAAAYLRTLVTAYDTAVGAVLQAPDPDTHKVTWGNVGFIQTSSVGGAINPDVPMRRSVVSLDVWAANPTPSKRPPWNRAFSLAELIVAATFDTPDHVTQAVVSLPTGYPDARVTEFTALTEPARRPSDPADYARVGFDVAISWHGLGTTWTITP